MGIWKRPAPKGEALKKWKNEWLQQITRSRDMDRHFKELLAKHCVLHVKNISSQKTLRYVSKSK